MFCFTSATRLPPLLLLIFVGIIAVVDGFYIKIQPNLQRSYDYTYEGKIYCSADNKLLCSDDGWMFVCTPLENDLVTHQCPGRKYDVEVRKVPRNANRGLEAGEVSFFKAIFRKTKILE